METVSVWVGGGGQRDWRHLWLADDGYLLVAVSPVMYASHIASFAELRAMYGREEIAVVVMGEDEADYDARQAWLDGRVDLVVVCRFGLAYGAVDAAGWREELMSGLRVRPVEGAWEIYTSLGETRRVADWAAVAAAGDDISWC